MLSSRVRDSMNDNDNNWTTYEIHELNAGKFKWRVIDMSPPSLGGDYWDFITLPEAEEWCRTDFGFSLENIGIKYTIHCLDGSTVTRTIYHLEQAVESDSQPALKIRRSSNSFNISLPAGVPGDTLRLDIGDDEQTSLCYWYTNKGWERIRPEDSNP